MKKTRLQPALAALSPEDKNQLADWLRKADYLDVLERVRKPLSEGGFGLTIHIHASKSSRGPDKPARITPALMKQFRPEF